MTISKARRRSRLAGNPLAELGVRAGFETGAARAAALSISRSHLMQVERGAIWPSAELIDRMSAAYHRPIEMLERAASLGREKLAQRMLEQARGIE